MMKNQGGVVEELSEAATVETLQGQVEAAQQALQEGLAGLVALARAEPARLEEPARARGRLRHARAGQVKRRCRRGYGRRWRLGRQRGTGGGRT
ncbi:MAG: hypothetical protein ACOX2L_00780 [Anaerolineae bacterium]|nr:hypothetical protein [Chloroflexota bacterium]